MDNKTKIAAIVVTYNRKELLIECLDALLGQTHALDAIYIVDNASTDGTPELLMEKGYIQRPLFPDKEPLKEIKTINLPSSPDKTIDIHYVRMPENTGGAGGFHEGAKRGYEDGYDWLWLMDDDAEPKQDALETLLRRSLFHNKETLCVTSLVVDTAGNIQIGTRGFYECSLRKIKPLHGALYNKSEIKIGFGTFVGFLLRADVIREIGLPLREFFIWGDDLEYSLRLIAKGNMYLIMKSVIMHKAAFSQIFHLSEKEMKVHRHLNFWRVIIVQRNMAYINKKYCGESIFRFVVTLLRRLVSVVYRDKDKLLKCMYLIKGMYNGRRGNLASDFLTPSKWYRIIKVYGDHN